MTTTQVTLTSVTVTSKKAFQNTLRALIVVGSLSGFLGGWSLLADAGKPISGNVVPTGAAAGTSTGATTGVTLQPLNLQALAPSSSTGSAFQPLQSQPTTSFSLPSLPILRTRGS